MGLVNSIRGLTVADGVIDKQTVNGLTLVVLAGELDLAVVPALRRDLTPTDLATLPDLALDLTQVRFMDCSAVGALLVAHKNAAAAGGCVRIIGTQRAPLRLLSMCGLDSVLCFHSAVTAATAPACSKHAKRVSGRSGTGATEAPGEVRVSESAHG
jgi:anti-sigma B factor antagonist